MPKLISDIGHTILQVGDMDKAVNLYCETLGFELKEPSPESSVISTKLGELTLYKTPKITPLVLRGADVTQSASMSPASRKRLINWRRKDTPSNGKAGTQEHLLTHGET